MLRTVIIDDEPLVIEGLSAMVDWQGHGFRICGVAEDGEKGLETIEKLQPDVVFTDVRMPGMDGLSLVKKYVEGHHNPVFFVIITGFSEFDYIKQAMDLNVVDYILKPIEPEDVHRILDHIREEHAKRIDIQQKLEQDIENVTRMTLNRLLEDHRKESLIQRGRFLLKIDQGSWYIYLRCSHRIRKFLENIDREDTQVKSISIDENGSQESLIVWARKEKLLKWKREVSRKFHEYEKKSEDYLYVAKEANSLTHLSEIHRKLQMFEKNRFYDTYTFLEIDSKEKINFSSELTVFEKDPIFGKYNLTDEASAIFQLNKLFHEIYSLKIDPDLVRLRYQLFLEKMAVKLEDDIVKTDIKNFSQFKKECRVLIQHYFLVKDNKQEGLVIEDVKIYIKKHISGDLKLKTVANFFGYNSVYMGQYFNRETGKKFRDYVLELRMDKAKELLLHTNATVSQIAREIGFRDRDYFVKKFKEFSGALPSEYRDE